MARPASIRGPGRRFIVHYSGNDAQVVPSDRMTRAERIRRERCIKSFRHGRIESARDLQLRLGAFRHGRIDAARELRSRIERGAPPTEQD